MADGAVPRLSCPACLSRLVWVDVKLAGSFPCPRCNCDLCVPPLYVRGLGWASFFLAGLLAYAFAASLLSWLVVIGVAFFLVNVALILTLGRAVPPRLRLAESRSLGLNVQTPPIT